MIEIKNDKQDLPGFFHKKDALAKILMAITYSGFFALVSGFLASPFAQFFKKISGSQSMNVNDPFTQALGAAWIASFLTFLAFWFLPNDWTY